jgi:hypothetical protein
VHQPHGVAEAHFPDAEVIQPLVKGIGALVDSRVEADYAGVEVKQANLLVNRGGIGERGLVR